MKLVYGVLVASMLFTLTGCQNKITLENAHTAESSYQYAKVTAFGGIKEMDSNHLVVTEAKDFTNKLLSAQFNRSYKKNNVADESILFSEHFKQNSSENQEVDFKSLNELYQRFELTTELVGITYHKLLIIGDDAFLDIEAKSILTACISNDIAKQLGYASGVNDTAIARFYVKLIYLDGAYLLYDYKRIPGEGMQLAFREYAPSIQVPQNVELPHVASKAPSGESPKETTAPTTVPNEDREKKEVESFINRLARLQNDRNYETLQGNEDYVLLSDEYIAKLNQKQDDVAVTKKVYQQYQLTTQFESLKINKIEKQGETYLVNVDIKSRLLHCISHDIAVKIGYSGGIGSVGEMSFNYKVRKINGTWKLADSQQIK